MPATQPLTAERHDSRTLSFSYYSAKGQPRSVGQNQSATSRRNESLVIYDYWIDLKDNVVFIDDSPDLKARLGAAACPPARRRAAIATP